MTPAEIAAELTSIYRTPSGTMALREVQGRILLAADANGGVWSNAGVGSGKTLALALLLAVIGGDRPLILTEAANLPQMKSDFQRLRLHWKIPTYYRLESYHTLSQRPNFLEDLRPTFVGLDEVQNIKPYKASGRARRVDRWRRAFPDVPMACLSGTPGEMFEDYAHQMVWAAPALRSDRGGPIPVSDEGRPEGPEFKALCRKLREDEAFHAAWWKRLRESPGIVVCDGTNCDAELQIAHTVLPPPADMEAHWRRLREDAEAPDGWVLDTGVGEQYQLARMLALGMYYEHIPRPPVEYTEPRKAWFGMCNRLIDAAESAPGGPYDTPGDVAKAVVGGRLPDGPLKAWQAVKDTYQPEVRAVWLSRHALDYAVAGGQRQARLATATNGGSIIWTSFIGLGEELSRITGWHYFGDGACDATGRHVDQVCRPCSAGERIEPVIICSSYSCRTGKNLQYRYSHNLFLSSPSGLKDSEQLLGRTHRSQQPCDVVTAEIVYGCLEDWLSYLKAEATCQENLRDLTATPKLLLAQHDRTSYPKSDDSLAWKRASRVEVT